MSEVKFKLIIKPEAENDLEQAIDFGKSRKKVKFRAFLRRKP